MAKFKVGDKVRVREDLAIDRDYDGVDFVDGMEAFKGKILKITSIEDYAYNVEENGWYWTDKMLEEIKEDKMEKTFREVIADIKEGEVWVQTEEGYVTEEIYCIDGGIYLTLKQVRSGFGTSGKYKLKRKEYTFEEAFKAYEKGKEIESCIEGQRYKKEGGEDYYFDFNKGKYILLEWDKDIFTITSIRNKWYIND